MGRVAHGISKLLRIFKVADESVNIDILFGTAAPGGDTDEQDDAALGSLYLRQNGASSTIYQKIGSANSTADWQENGSSTAQIGKWRPEFIRAVTGEAVVAGVRNLTTTPFTDDDVPLLTAADFAVGEFIISNEGTTPTLLEVTAVASPNVTFAAPVSAPAISENDTWLTPNYLPDSPGDQEIQSIVNYNGSVMIKVGDANWEFATGIQLSGSYSAGSGTVSSADTVESALEKLDGNQIALISLSGVAQGSTNLGAWTSPVDLLFSATSTNKALFQRIGDLLMQLRGVQSASLSALGDVDSVPVASVKACAWFVTAYETADATQLESAMIYASNDGTSAQDNEGFKHKFANVAKFSVDINAGNMRLRAEPVGSDITVIARRIEVVKTLL